MNEFIYLFELREVQFSKKRAERGILFAASAAKF